MGHVDHGKTTLTAAITAVLAKRLPSAVNRDEVVQAQDTEDPQQSKDAEDHQHLCSAIDKGYIGGKYGDEVYDAVKGKDVPPRFMKAVDTQDVFDGEYNGDNPLAPMQKIPRAMG